MKVVENNKVPLIDLFAGAGGLGEGFSAFSADGRQPFSLRLSVECDPAAHATLELRSFFGQFATGSAPEAYYRHLRGEISREALFAEFPSQAERAIRSAWQATLGSEDLSDAEVDARIHEAVGVGTNWVLVGGPPCQAYSVIGRARNSAKPEYRAEDDHRHFLYREYLRVLRDHSPAVFVMENVTGVLSAKVAGRSIFRLMIDDLQNPHRALGAERAQAAYRIYSVVRRTCDFDLFGDSDNSPADYIVECEKFGIPQRRHRVFLFGVRQDIRVDPKTLAPGGAELTVRQALVGLPKIRAGLSARSVREPDSREADWAWREALRDVSDAKWMRASPDETDNFARTRAHIAKTLNSLKAPRARTGAIFIRSRSGRAPDFAKEWFFDPRLGGVCNHEARSHMQSDFHRYLWAASFASANGLSPRLKDFPAELLPEHKNVSKSLENDHFADRFKVQLREEASTTVMSHIAKDGHYYIHPDPSQCRSLTVREAARLQTFPDNYFFCGNRTEQYTQVGNAVPPLIARQIAEIVHELMDRAGLADDGSNLQRATQQKHVANQITRHRPGTAGQVADAQGGAEVQAA